MRIKTSPKEATLIIDNLVKEGSQILDEIIEEFFDEYNKQLQIEKEEEEAEQSKGNWITTTTVIKRPGRNVVDSNFMKSLNQKFNEWNSKTYDKLETILQDYSPLYAFETSSADLSKIEKDVHNRNFDILRGDFEAKLQTLISFYNELNTASKNPINYLPDKAQIWFYDFMCQLTQESNEANLCEYLFQYGVGEPREFEDAYCFITGNTPGDKKPKNWEKTIINAYDGINGKTNKAFGFPIMSKQKLKISLHLPSRLIQNF